MSTGSRCAARCAAGASLRRSRPSACRSRRSSARACIGSGGLFGYLGLFKVDGGGRVGAALTSRRSAVLVRGRGASVLVSPADPDGLLRAVEGEVA